MSKLYKIIITLAITVIVYLLIFNTILYVDPDHPNERGLKSLALFPTIFISYFFASYLARK